MKKISKLRNLTRLVLVTGDVVTIPVVYFLSYFIRSKSALLFFQEKMPMDRMEIVNHRLWILLIMHILLLYLHGFYDTMSLRKKSDILARTIRIGTFEMLVLVAVYFFSQDILFPRSIFVLLWLLIISCTSAWHGAWRKVFNKRLPTRNVIIVGTGENVRNVIREVQRLPMYGLEIIGVLKEDDDCSNDTRLLGYPILGCRSDLLDLLKTGTIDEVIISSGDTWQDDLVGAISRMEQIPARICVLPTCYEILIGRINHIRLYDIPLIEMIKHPDIPVSKRFLDFTGALVLLIVSIPLFILSSLLILVFMGKPVLFRQERLGKNQKPFVILKFRTMIRNAEENTGPILTSEADERVTPLGRWLRKYRIDEIPQLINILRGEMSFVGPRPERPFFAEKYLVSVKGYGERFKALPGLTGLAQVNGGYDTRPENKLKYDLAYIYNHTLWLDLKILVETIKVILTGRINP
ncbi:sugar transferase [bacterium]|nr:sugar transferase [candidate division CSSED10-310 bacterium]